MHRNIAVLPFGDVSLVRLASDFHPVSRNLGVLDMHVIVHEMVVKAGPQRAYFTCTFVLISGGLGPYVVDRQERGQDLAMRMPSVNLL